MVVDALYSIYSTSLLGALVYSRERDEEESTGTVQSTPVPLDVETTKRVLTEKNSYCSKAPPDATTPPPRTPKTSTVQHVSHILQQEG